MKLYKHIDEEFIYITDLPVLHDPEQAVLAKYKPEHEKELIAALSAKKSRGGFGVSIRDREIIKIFRGNEWKATVPYFYGEEEGTYMAVMCHLTYVHSILVAIKRK